VSKSYFSIFSKNNLVGLSGVEPPCNQLTFLLCIGQRVYNPLFLVPPEGIEPPR